MSKSEKRKRIVSTRKAEKSFVVMLCGAGQTGISFWGDGDSTKKGATLGANSLGRLRSENIRNVNLHLGGEAFELWKHRAGVRGKNRRNRVAGFRVGTQGNLDPGGRN